VKPIRAGKSTFSTTAVLESYIDLLKHADKNLAAGRRVPLHSHWPAVLSARPLRTARRCIKHQHQQGLAAPPSALRQALGADPTLLSTAPSTSRDPGP
jgi:hypothetical protein